MKQAAQVVESDRPAFLTGFGTYKLRSWLII